jgi:hypothetical protein
MAKSLAMRFNLCLTEKVIAQWPLYPVVTPYSRAEEPNPSFERTCNGLRPSAAAHGKRHTSSLRGKLLPHW